MKKVVLKLDLHDDKAKKKALKAVSTFPGIDSIAMDMKEQKLTLVIGAADPIPIVSKLRKFWRTELLSLGPAKEPEKGRTQERRTEKEESKKEDAVVEKKIDLLFYPSYNPPPIIRYDVVIAEENPNFCAIL